MLLAKLAKIAEHEMAQTDASELRSQIATFKLLARAYAREF
jgi:hypothetical protein